MSVEPLFDLIVAAFEGTMQHLIIVSLLCFVEQIVGRWRELI